MIPAGELPQIVDTHMRGSPRVQAIFAMLLQSKISHVPLSAARPCNQSAWAGPAHMRINFMRHKPFPVFVVRAWRMKFYALGLRRRIILSAADRKR